MHSEAMPSFQGERLFEETDDAIGFWIVCKQKGFRQFNYSFSKGNETPT